MRVFFTTTAVLYKKRAAAGRVVATIKKQKGAKVCQSIRILYMYRVYARVASSTCELSMELSRNFLVTFNFDRSDIGPWSSVASPSPLSSSEAQNLRPIRGK